MSSSLITPASTVRSRSIRWGWTGRLAEGYLTVESGIEGLGKSVFAAWMIARLSHGELPGEWRGRPVDVLIVAGEDGIADTWAPRLAVARADMDRVAFLNLDALPVGWNLRDGIGELRQAVDEANARVVFIDSALDYMPPPRQGESINSPTWVRQALGPLKRLVREQRLVGLFSMHPPKARSADFRDLVQASQAFSAIPRIGLLFAYHPEDAELPEHERRRVLLRGKGNLGRDPGALEFRVVGHDHIHDDGCVREVACVEDVAPSTVTMADLAPDRVLGVREPTKAEQAAEVLRELLGDGEWHPSAPIRQRLAELGLDAGSVRKHAMGLASVKARKQPGNSHGPWEWQIAKGPNRTDPCPARARSLPDGGLLEKEGRNASSNGKGPRVRDPGLPSKGPSGEDMSRARAREGAHDLRDEGA